MTNIIATATVTIFTVLSTNWSTIGTYTSLRPDGRHMLVQEGQRKTNVYASFIMDGTNYTWLIGEATGDVLAKKRVVKQVQPFNPPPLPVAPTTTTTNVGEMEIRE